MKFKKIIVCVAFFVSSLSLYQLYVHNACPVHDPLLIRRIAVFQPVTHPALDEIAQGYIDTMQKDAQFLYQFDRYNGNGNKILMRAQAQEMLSKNYDLIVTIGAGCTLTMKEASVRKQSTTPIVFTAIDDVERVDLQSAHMTGVVYDINYRKQLDLLCAIIPTVKTVLLAYDQSQGLGLEKDRNEIESILQEKDVVLQCVEIATIGEIQQKLTCFMDKVDVIMILKDTLLASGVDSLVTLCQRYKVPLLASDLNSGDKGAVLAYGVYEYESGVLAAVQAKQILEEKKQPSQLSILVTSDSKMKVNCSQIALQGLDLDCSTFSMPQVQLSKKGQAHV